MIFLALILLAGCAGYTPLEELEAQALLTGDWSAVQRRERMQAGRNPQNSMQCPSGTIGYCVVYTSSRRCSCIDSAMMNVYLSH
jgi:hypothetical protein